MNDVKEILKSENIYFDQATIGGIECTVGYNKQFKWSWLATQLNTFFIIGHTDKTIDKNVIEQFSTDCYNYALKNNKGWMRGLQSGIGSIAILAGEKIEDSAIQFCRKLGKKHFSAFEIPVLYDTNKKETLRYQKDPMWGKIYFPYFSKTIDQITGKM